MDLEELDAFLNSKESTKISLLEKHKDAISYLLSKKASQKIIMEYLFSEDKELSNIYSDRAGTFQSLLSKFIAKNKLKKGVQRNVKSEKEIVKKEVSKNVNVADILGFKIPKKEAIENNGSQETNDKWFPNND